ncbi:hypothetical protein IEQ34_014911 [Dendrobium chrysotoxum]|uniref:Uncharacterized protein n=1 Tax=Dendrobium chrysotoxum TaxID=161865 RepID=A0AAV7G533_DENCH|nr:hypothetical protein IEQ34_014911 [Dendrobium chrysotoxum]
MEAGKDKNLCENVNSVDSEKATGSTGLFQLVPRMLVDKDASEWEEDVDEYIRKNLPSNLDDISGLTEDLFTARKSAINLLGVIAMSKGLSVVSTASKYKKHDRNKKKSVTAVSENYQWCHSYQSFPYPVGQKTLHKKFCRIIMAF